MIASDAHALQGTPLPVNPPRPVQTCVQASHGRPSAGFSATKNPLETNHAPTDTLLLTRNAAIAQSGQSARPRTARNASAAAQPRRTSTANASAMAQATIGHAS